MKMLEKHDINSLESSCIVAKQMADITIHLYRQSNRKYCRIDRQTNLVCSLLFFFREESSEAHWYKFDDTDVSECKMDDDEELRSQCFGGDYPAQSFDQPIMKR